MKIRFMREHGQGTVEYAILIAIIALAVVAVLALVHDTSIHTAITKFLTVSDPLAASPASGKTPDPWTDQIIAVAVLVTVMILIVYSFMHSGGPDHKPPRKVRRRK